MPLTSLCDIICQLYFRRFFKKSQTRNLPSQSILNMAKGSLYQLLVPLAKQNERKHLCYNSPHRFCYISPHRQYLNIFVDYKQMNKGDLTKLCVLCRLIIKLMQEKVKVWQHSMQKKYFSNPAENSKLTFTVKMSILRLHFYNYTFPLRF